MPLLYTGGFPPPPYPVLVTAAGDGEEQAAQPEPAADATADPDIGGKPNRFGASLKLAPTVNHSGL